VSLSAGKATSTSIASLTLAGHTVMASYSGDARFIASDNAASPLTQTVNKPSRRSPSPRRKIHRPLGTLWLGHSSERLGGGATPAGSVQFRSMDANFDGSVPDGARNQPPPWPHSARLAHHRRVYSGDLNFNTRQRRLISPRPSTPARNPATGGNATLRRYSHGLYTSLTGRPIRSQPWSCRRGDNYSQSAAGLFSTLAA